MDIDIIKKSRLLVFLVLPLLFLSCNLFNGKVSNVKNAEVISDCKILEEFFDVDTNGIKEFKSELVSFIESEHKYDILKIFMKGGNHQDSYSKRWHLNRTGKWVKRYQQDSLFSTVTLDKPPIGLDDLLSTIPKGSFIEHCQLYISNMNSFIFYIKEDGEVKFQYLSVTDNQKNLNEGDRNKISNGLKVFSFLEEE